MKVYHTLNAGTYNSAAFFLEQRLPITNTGYGANISEHTFLVGNQVVAKFNEMTGVLEVYRDLNSNNRCYGNLH